MKEKFIVFNNIQELFNIPSFLFDNSVEMRNHLITCGMHSFSINFCPRFGQFWLQDLHTELKRLLKEKNLSVFSIKKKVLT